MHYNNFTIQYIKILKRDLNININDNGDIIFNRKSVTIDNIKKLTDSLKEIWESSTSSIGILKNKTDSKIQAGLFGLHEDFDFAIRTGFLTSDRIVLVDYLYDRVLSKKGAESINIEQVLQIAISLVKLLPLAKNGRIVLIPNPFTWNENSKKLIKEVSENATLSISLISMLNMLSICKICNLHPYTIASSHEQYKRILDSEIDHVDMIGKDGGKYAYEGILGSLITQRVLTETSFSCSKSIPIEKYVEIITKHSEFYREYLAVITAGGSMQGDVNIESIQQSIDKVLKRGNQNVTGIIKGLSKTSDISGAGLAIAPLVITTLSPSVAIVGGALILLGQLGSLLKDKTKDENTIISLFKDLDKVSKKK